MTTDQWKFTNENLPSYINFPTYWLVLVFNKSQPYMNGFIVVLAKLVSSIYLFMGLLVIFNFEHGNIFKIMFSKTLYCNIVSLL